MGVEFHLTRRGAKFYDHDVPRIAEALEGIAVGLQRLRKTLQDETPRKQMSPVETLEAYRKLYITLLKLPLGKTRLDCQEHMCWLRDRIAELEGRSEQDVQDDYEHRVVTGAV